MTQGLAFKDMSLMIKGKGRIADPCDGLSLYAPECSGQHGAYEIIAVPKVIRLSRKIGTVVYDVTGTFSPDGSATLFSRFKGMILESQN